MMVKLNLAVDSSSAPPSINLPSFVLPSLTYLFFLFAVTQSATSLDWPTASFL